MDGRLLVGGALAGLALAGRRGSRSIAVSSKPGAESWNTNYPYFGRAYWRVSSRPELSALRKRLLANQRELTEALVDEALGSLEWWRGHYAKEGWGEQKNAYEYDIKFHSDVPESVQQIFEDDERFYEAFWFKIDDWFEFRIEEIKRERNWIGEVERKGRQGGHMVVHDAYEHAGDLEEQWGNREEHIERVTLLGPEYTEGYYEELVDAYIGVLALRDDLTRIGEIVREEQAELRAWLSSEEGWEWELAEARAQRGDVNRRGSRRRGSRVLKVGRVNVKRAGMKPRDIIRARTRGRAHDPRRPVAVEVLVQGGDAQEVQSDAARRVATREAQRHLGGGSRWARRVSGPYQDRGIWTARWEVS